MRASAHIASLHAEMLQLVQEKVAMTLPPDALKMLGVGLGSAGIGAAGAHMLTHNADEDQRLRTRNRSFGAGVAAGVAGPQVLKGIYNIAQGQGFLPAGTGG